MSLLSLYFFACNHIFGKTCIDDFGPFSILWQPNLLFGSFVPVRPVLLVNSTLLTNRTKNTETLSGCKLSALSEDATIRIWDLESGHLDSWILMYSENLMRTLRKIATDVKTSDTEASSMLTWCRQMDAVVHHSIFAEEFTWYGPMSPDEKCQGVAARFPAAVVHVLLSSHRIHGPWRSSIPSNACPALWPGHLMQPHWCRSSADVNLSKKWPLTDDIRCFFLKHVQYSLVLHCRRFLQNFNIVSKVEPVEPAFLLPRDFFSPITAGQGTSRFMRTTFLQPEVFIRRYLRWSLLSCQWTAPRRATAGGAWSLSQDISSRANSRRSSCRMVLQIQGDINHKVETILNDLNLPLLSESI